MRISDWSSDVCTSDLLHAPGVAEASGALRGRDGTGPAQAHTGEAMRGRRRGASAPLLFSPCRKAPTPGEVTEQGGSGGPRRVSTLDRKSVVKGTNVAVCGGLVGSRRIKKKTRRTTKEKQ